MKKVIIILSLLCIGFVSNAQTPDTLQLSPKELFGESDDWNDVGILQSYIDFSKDVLSSSNLSIGIIGRQISTTLNLGYSKSSMNGQWGHSFATSINPAWNYYGVGYGLSRNTQNRTTTLQTFYSTDFDFQKNINLSIVDVFRTKKWGTFGSRGSTVTTCSRAMHSFTVSASKSIMRLYTGKGFSPSMSSRRLLISGSAIRRNRLDPKSWMMRFFHTNRVLVAADVRDDHASTFPISLSNRPNGRKPNMTSLSRLRTALDVMEALVVKTM